MGGVDKMDQLTAVYRTKMRQTKWWWPIFCYLLDASVTNARLLMRKVNPDNKEFSNLLNFRTSLATTLLLTSAHLPIDVELSLRYYQINGTMVETTGPNM